MTKPHFLQKLALLGVAALGAIAATGIAGAPAQAIILNGPSSLAWGDATSDFFSDFEPGSGDTLTIDFNVDPNTIVIDSVFGDFTADFSTGIASMDNAPQTGMFLYEDGSGDGSDELNPAIYVLQNELVMSFDPAPNSTGNPNDSTEYDWVVPVGTRFEGFFDTPNTVELSLCASCGSRPYLLADGMFNDMDNTFQFNDGSTGANGSYIAETQTQGVPEPTSLLGIFAVAGLGLGLKGKKQA